MFEKYYKEYCNEVHQILATYLFWRMIRKRTALENELLDALNSTPLSWIFTQNSLQISFIITLGRVFDTDKRALSVDELLKCCIKEIDIFKPENLRTRRITANNGIEPEWLLEFIAKSYQPTAEDFNKLKSEVAKHKKVFENIYRPIRHKLIAHKEKKYLDKGNELWAETNIKEIEEIIWFLNDLKETLFQTFQNGYKPKLLGLEPDIDFYEQDFGELLDTVKKTYEHAWVT